jgi:hypothetical protein
MLWLPMSAQQLFTLTATGKAVNLKSARRKPNDASTHYL